MILWERFKRMEHYSAVKKREILPFATTWMHLKSIVLTGISQSENDKYHMILLIWGIYEQNKLINKIETDSQIENRLTAFRGAEGCGTR